MDCWILDDDDKPYGDKGNDDPDEANELNRGDGGRELKLLNDC